MPKKIGSQLELFDCLSCDICLPVCPNAANFHFRIKRESARPYRYRWENTQWMPLAENASFQLKKEWQIGNIAEFCNDCGNCDTFCPEDGGPYLRKPRFFIYRSTFDNSASLDGFHFVNRNVLLARIKNKAYRLERSSNDSSWIWHTPVYDLLLNNDGCPLPGGNDSLIAHKEIDIKIFFIMKTIMTMFEVPYIYPQSLLLSV
ncbi:MAG TPA: hypothetical protein EYP36_02560 [Calditrichaeota bacterium]|nr:hypothetical protein [Calditrichota bacterium]